MASKRLGADAEIWRISSTEIFRYCNCTYRPPIGLKIFLHLSMSMTSCSKQLFPERPTLIFLHHTSRTAIFTWNSMVVNTRLMQDVLTSYSRMDVFPTHNGRYYWRPKRIDDFAMFTNSIWKIGCKKNSWKRRTKM